MNTGTVLEVPLSVTCAAAPIPDMTMQDTISAILLPIVVLLSCPSQADPHLLKPMAVCVSYVLEQAALSISSNVLRATESRRLLCDSMLFPSPANSLPPFVCVPLWPAAPMDRIDTATLPTSLPYGCVAVSPVVRRRMSYVLFTKMLFPRTMCWIAPAAV